MIRLGIKDMSPRSMQIISKILTAKFKIMLAKIFSCALYGIDAFRITIEVNIINKGVGQQITGQPDDAVKESLSRIDVAISGNGFHMPRTKISINLAPADVRKTGTAYDLPIPIG